MVWSIVLSFKNFKNFKKEWCNIFALNKNVEKLIINLKRNFKLILLSNTDKLHFKYLKNKYKIINAFDAYVLSYEVGYRKPNLLIFSDALKKAKTLPFNCIYIDDTPAQTILEIRAKARRLVSEKKVGMVVVQN